MYLRKKKSIFNYDMDVIWTAEQVTHISNYLAGFEQY